MRSASQRTHGRVSRADQTRTIAAPILKLAVIGHTNTGKTSVIRSLLRDHTIGEVRDAAGTTSETTKYPMIVEGLHLATIIDTPGLEDAGALLSLVHQRQATSGESTATAITAVIASDDLGHQAMRDAMPLLALADADAGVVVFDAREPPLPKYWEEYELISRRGVPIIGLINCARAPGAMLRDWEDALRREGMNAIVYYDAWAATEQDAQQLFTKIHELVPPEQSARVESLQRHRVAAERRALQRTCEALSICLVSLAATRQTTKRGQQRDAQSILETVPIAWTRFIASTAGYWGLSTDQLTGLESDLRQMTTGTDLADAVAGAGIGGAVGLVTGGAAGAAAKGLAIDASAGGATLGIGAATGAVIGVAVTGRRLAHAAFLRSRGEEEYRLAPQAIAGVLERGTVLIERLRHFGAASQQSIAETATETKDITVRGGIEKTLKRLTKIPPRAASPPSRMPEVSPDERQVKAIAREIAAIIEVHSRPT